MKYFAIILTALAISCSLEPYTAEGVDVAQASTRCVDYVNFILAEPPTTNFTFESATFAVPETLCEPFSVADLDRDRELISQAADFGRVTLRGRELAGPPSAVATVDGIEHQFDIADVAEAESDGSICSVFTYVQTD